MYAPICGYSISNRGISHNTTLNNPVYKVLLLDTNYTLNNDSRNKDSKVIITNKVEEVYCVTVSTGLIMVRGTNGVTTICGNCAMLEHGTVYLKLGNELVRGIQPCDAAFYKYKLNPYSKYTTSRIESEYKTIITGYVTTNLRVLVENGWMDDLKYICEPTEYHEKRVCVRFICDRGVSHEYVRHRVFSFAQESTRYCNYSKDKFGNELTFIQPCYLNEAELAQYGPYHLVSRNKSPESIFICSLNNAEKDYLTLIESGWKAQEARAVLPNALKTELVMTGFATDWKHFFDLRDAGSAHPQAQELAKPLHEEFIKRGYVDE